MATPRKTASRLTLQDRDVRLIALDIAARTGGPGESTGTDVVRRAEAFLAFLAGGGSGN